MGLCASSPSTKDGGNIMQNKTSDFNDLAAVDPQPEMMPSPAAAAAARPAAAAAAPTPPAPGKPRPPTNSASLPAPTPYSAAKATARSRRASNRAPSNQSSDAACAMVEDSDDSENESLKPLKELSKTKKPGDVSTFGGAGGTVGGRPEDMMLMIGLVARPASIQLQELSSQIKRLSRIGQGAGGVVYKGLWTGVPVAIKFMLSETPDKLHQPAREAILSRYVSHPNVVQTYTYDVTMLVESSTGAAALSPDTPLKQMLPNTNTNGSKASPALKTIPSVECSEASMPMSGVTGASGPPNLGGNRLAGLPSDRLIPSGAALLPRAAYLGTANSLNIFDLGSQSTVDIHGSLKPGSDESDDENGNEGWKMSDVLLRLGATPGQFLTHIILELCDAGTLITAISGDMFSASKDPAERGKVKAMLRTAREIAHGMAHLHSLGIVHGDLKPGNILLKPDAGDIRGFVSKVADFGLARRLETAEPLEESSGEPIGTLSYMAPEAMKGTLQKGSDVYSFGIILWQFCTGLTPYKGLHHAHIYYGKKNGSLTLSWPAETYSPVRRLAEMCMDEDPSKRPSFEQICKALNQIKNRLKRSSNSRPAAATSTSASLSETTPVLNGQNQEEDLVANAPSPFLPYELMPDPEMP